MLLREHDTDVLFAVQKAIQVCNKTVKNVSIKILNGRDFIWILQDLDTVETGVDGVPSMNAEEDRENERKLREERLIAR